MNLAPEVLEKTGVSGGYFKGFCYETKEMFAKVGGMEYNLTKEIK